jgi:hypothetical protein
MASGRAQAQHFRAHPGDKTHGQHGNKPFGQHDGQVRQKQQPRGCGKAFIAGGKSHRRQQARAQDAQRTAAEGGNFCPAGVGHARHRPRNT